MVLLGIDPHKDTHTVVAVDQAGRQLDQTTVPARSPGHGQLVGWARTRWPTCWSLPWPPGLSRPPCPSCRLAIPLAGRSADSARCLPEGSSSAELLVTRLGRSVLERMTA